MLVGKEPFCDFHSIQDAVDALEQQSPDQAETLYVLPGVYEEKVRIYRSNLTIIGIGQVEIRGNLYARQHDESGRELGTFGTPTLFLGGRCLILENLVIVNAAGQGVEIGQAIAVYAHCDETVFRHCTFKGYQDTLFTGPLPPAPKAGNSFGGIPLREHHSHYRQLYQHCCIEGTVDFIFGGATALFEHCEIRSLRHARNEPGYITAASTPEGNKHGYIFQECFLTAEAGVNQVYLGRPWREYAKTDFVDCKMGSHIHPRGWDSWGNSSNERSVRYREFGTLSEEALRYHRVPWAICSGFEKWMYLRKEQVFADTDFWKEEIEL